MKERQFRVRWEIDVYAVNALDAAEQARSVQLDRGSDATIFEVGLVNKKTDNVGKPVKIDLSGLDEKLLD